MPWKILVTEQARRRFIEEWLKRGKDRGSFASLCRLHQISRSCAYRWWNRFRAGGVRALREKERTPQTALRLRARWEERLRAACLQERFFGPKKLWWKLRGDYPRSQVPCVRTLSRWLKSMGRVRRQIQRAKPGPKLRLRGRLAGRCVNDVWSLDFKGQFRTADGQWVHALTVRDVASCYVLCVQHVPKPNEVQVGAVMRRLFRRYGLPKALRSDNGAPFGAGGPRGWSGLSVSWVKLGIRMEYGRPRCPQDNAAHEQMHRVLKKFAATPVSTHPHAQQRRFERWRRHYNQHRPHEALGLRTPAERYRPSRRRLPASSPCWKYPAAWLRLRPDAKGRLLWQKRQRLIGKAFIGETLGAYPLHPDILAVYLGPYLLGHLHAQDPAGLRHARWRQPLQPTAGGAAPLPNPPRSF
ncbi:MAG: integrase core domain-containing protein [Opitutus sp.]